MARGHHICFVNPNVGGRIMETGLPAGGSETQIVGLAKHLVAEGRHRVSILTHLGKGTSSFRREGVQWYHIPFDYLQGRRHRFFYDLGKLLWRLQRLQPDFVLLKHPRHLLFPLVCWGKYNNFCVLFHAGIDRDFRLDLLAQEPYWSRQMYLQGLRMTGGVIAQTRRQQNGIRRLTKSRVHYLPSIFVGKMRATLSRISYEYFLWVGSNSERKRPQIFIRLASAFPMHRFMMIFQPGDQTGGINPENAPDNMTFVSSCPREEIWQYYAGAKALVSTSCLEGFPNVFLESWDYGKPVISLGFDPDDIISRHGLGRVAQDFDGLVAAIRELEDSDRLVKNLGEAGRRYLELNHVPGVVVPRLWKILDEHRPQ